MATVDAKRFRLALLIAALPLLGWWLYGLFDLDEGFYAAVVAEMNRRHDWVTPWYNGQPWFEKPILLYWLAKPMVLLFGESIGPRLPSVLSSVALYALCGSFAARRWGNRAGIWAILILGSSLLVVALGRMMMTDPLLSLSLTAALLWFYESLVDPDRRRFFRTLSAAALGFSMLAKGPVGPILFVVILAVTFGLEPELRPAYRGGWLVGFLVFGLVVASWYLPCWLANRDAFVQKFLIEQNVGRFTGGDQAHSLPFLKGLPIYPITLLVGMAPWSFLLPKAWPRKPDADPAARFLVVWFCVIFAFFLISSAKLPHYVLTCVPPLALMVARARREREEGLLPAITLAVVAVLANVGFYAYYQQGHAEVHALARYVREHGGGAVAVYQMPRREQDRGTGTFHLRETSHPSLLFYLNDTVIDAEEPSQLTGARWVITRAGRIPDPEPFGLAEVQKGRDYALYQRR